ncbi:SPOR domain-containing protein [Desulfobacterales bacterium HSG17]|nr:SPOR domain-containing protein [Desulfobacterales bacterium HSG17]
MMAIIFPQLLKFINVLIVALSCMLMLSACYKKDPSLLHSVSHDVAGLSAISRVAVLPFVDLTNSDADLAQLVRNGFYSHFSVRPYTDVEISRVDVILGLHTGMNTSLQEKINSQKLGRWLECDAVIRGAVVRFERVFVGIYAQMLLEVAISLESTQTGKQLYQDQREIRYHEGGLPLSIVSIPMIGIRSSMSLREIEKVRLVNDLCRIMVADIPYKNAGIRQEGAYFLETRQFSAMDSALRQLEKLRNHGYPAFMDNSRQDSFSTYQIRLGPYESLRESGELQKVLMTRIGMDLLIRWSPENKSFPER